MGEWRDLVLGESLELLIDNRGKNPPYVTIGVPSISGKTVTASGLVLETARAVSRDTWAKGMTSPTRAGDVILTSEAPLGRVARIPSDDPVYVAQRVFGLRGKPGVLDSGFLYYAFKTKSVQAELAGRATGTTVVGIRQPELRKVLIPAPGFSEQLAIAEVLGALDDKIAANDQLADRGKSLVRAVFDRYVSARSDLPAASVLEPVLGGTPSRSDEALWDGAVPWASARDISSAPHGLIVRTDEGISQRASKTRRLSPLPVGTVVITARGTVGKVAQLSIPAAINQSCYGLMPDVIPPGCLRLVVEDFAVKAKAMAHGSVFDTITKATFDHVGIPDLSRAEWLDLEALIAPTDALVNAAVLENNALAKTRDQLLPLLMSGKVTVKGVENEVGGLV